MNADPTHVNAILATGSKVVADAIEAGTADASDAPDPHYGRYPEAVTSVTPDISTFQPAAPGFWLVYDLQPVQVIGFVRVHVKLGTVTQEEFDASVIKSFGSRAPEVVKGNGQAVLEHLRGEYVKREWDEVACVLGYRVYAPIPAEGLTTHREVQQRLDAVKPRRGRS